MSIREEGKKALRWLKRLGRWLLNVIYWLWRSIVVLRDLFAVLFVFALVFFFFDLCHERLEQGIRFIGMGFQIWGFVTVLKKLSAAKRQFQLPTMLKRIGQYLKQFPLFRPRHQILSATGMAVGVSFGAARLREVAGPTTPLNQRVELLERQYAELFDEVGRMGQEIKTNVGELSGALKAESAERQKADQKNETQLREAVVGNLQLDYAGVVYFAFGTIAGTASGEIAKWLGVPPCW